MGAYHSREAYERRLAERLAAPTPLKGPAVFWHIACMNHWKDVLIEQLRVLAHVGLRSVSACILGSDVEAAYCRSQAHRRGVDLNVLLVDPNLALYEGPTIQAVWEFARNNLDHAALYFHTKGVAVSYDAQRTQWRRAMARYTIGQWRRSIGLLETHDITGLCWQENRDFPHYAGNFWMARADWLANLSNPSEYSLRHPGMFWAGQRWGSGGRMWCETWIGSECWHHLDAYTRNRKIWSSEAFSMPTDIDGFDYDCDPSAAQNPLRGQLDTNTVWSDSGVETYQNRGEFESFLSLYQRATPKTVLEIGSLFGGTLYHLMKRAPGATVISVDMDVASTDPRFAAQQRAREVWPSWARSAGVTLHSIISKSGDSVDAVAGLAPRGIDVLFIDGDHYGALKDFEAYWDLVNPGGLIGFHDIFRRQESVAADWAAIKNAGHDCLELCSVINQRDWGIGVVRKASVIKLAIITPCSRPENLPVMREAIEAARTPGLDITWHVVHDAEAYPVPFDVHCENPWPWIIQLCHRSKGGAGKPQINHVLATLAADTFVWVLDDDNLPHKDFFRVFFNGASYHPKKMGFAFGQQIDGEEVREAAPVFMSAGEIDQAQYVWHERLRKGVFIPEGYLGDGHFAEFLHATDPGAWVFINKPLTFYNRLRWPISS